MEEPDEPLVPAEPLAPEDEELDDPESEEVAVLEDPEESPPDFVADVLDFASRESVR